MERTSHSYPGYHGQLFARDGKIHDPFVTLEDLFRNLPEDVTFDVELSNFTLCPILPPCYSQKSARCAF